MELGIEGRHALVCGASKGLGLACARALAREGARVTMVARTPDVLGRAVAELNAQHPRFEARGIVADVSVPAGRDYLIDTAGAVDILVSNAGGPPPGSWRSWTADQWYQAFDANALSAISLIQGCIEAMVAGGFGRVVNITSITVKMPQKGLGLSTAARLALTGFTSSIVAELAASNVIINNLLPGYFDTERMRSAISSGHMQKGSVLPSGDTLDEQLVRKLESIPAKRFGSPTEFGEFCAFLCSDQAGYVTGQNILMDGGLFTGIA